jgi:putative protein-disulfide isomerase
MAAVLHYIYDPLCGWCYGAEPLAWAASDIDGLPLEMHAGGLWPQPTSLPDPTRRYIQQADARIAKMTGQPYGDSYLNGLLLDPSMVLESRPPTAAILAAQSLDSAKGLAMLKGIQHAHYEYGLRVVDPAVLVAVAAELGLDREKFVAAMGEAPVDEHIRQSQRLMGELGAQGFPFFALQIGDDWYPVPHGRFASSPAGFREWLTGQVQSLSATRH